MSELIAAGAVLWRRSPAGGVTAGDCTGAEAAVNDIAVSDVKLQSNAPESNVLEDSALEDSALDGVEVAVVHRPRYDDWSLPKGKPHPGEPLLTTAVREVTEETGHIPVLGPRLGSTRYSVPAGQKVAYYWSGRASNGHFTPGQEVDELRWLSPAKAADLLSYPHDRALLGGITLATTVTATVLLVRHAKAGKRAEWEGDDDLRPLSAAGQRQADALRTLLPLFGVQRVHSAPQTRCRQTIADLAVDLGVPVIDEPLLSEQGYLADPAAGWRRLIEIVPGPAVVVCSQGGVIPDVVRRLAREAGLALPDAPPSRKGSFWSLSFGADPPVLLAADYYDDPLGRTPGADQ